MPQPRPINQGGRALRRFLQHRPATISLAVLAVVVLLALMAPLVAGRDPNLIDLELRNVPPSWAHPMGTDYNGRDLYARVLYAGRVSLGFAFTAVLLAEALGVALGIASGYWRGWVDAVIMRTVDFVLTLPLLPLLLALSAILSPSIPLLIGVLVGTNWVTSARLVRSQVLSLREQEFIVAAQAIGVGPLGIVTRHLLPNTLTPVIVNVTLGISTMILLEATLSYLGFGIRPPDASWGNMLQDVNRTVLMTYPWQAIFPGAMIFITSLCVNFVGDGLRDALDPR